MRRHVRALAALAVVPFALVACSDASPEEGATDGGDAGSTDGASISYWLWDANQLPAYQECADTFAESSGITVTIEQYGWDDYWSGLTNNFVAGNAPDVFTDHLSQYPQYASQNQLLDINPMIEADDVDLTIYQDGLADLWVDEAGGRYGLPKDWDTIAVFYNTEMVEAAGLSQADMAELTWNPTDGGTYEEAIAAMTVDANGVRGNEAGFDKGDVAVYGLGLAGSGGAFGQTEWSMYAMANGFEYANQNPWGTEWNFGSAEFQDTMTWWRSLIEKGYMPTLEIAQSGVSLQENYGAGKYAMITEGSWNTNAYMTLEGVSTAIAPTPIGPNDVRASLFNGLADSIWIGTDEPEASWEWVKFLGSAECQDLVAAQAVVFPAVKSSLEIANDAFAAKGYDVSAFTVHVEDGTTHLAPIANHFAEIQAAMTAAGERFMSFQAETDAYTAANDEVNALFE
jgi:multiple sugar transport system substrate-binding protein